MGVDGGTEREGEREIEKEEIILYKMRRNALVLGGSDFVSMWRGARTSIACSS